MPHISIRDLSVDFIVFGAGSQSLKKQIVSQATGGRLARTDGVVVVRAIENLSIEIKDGDRLGLVGHNGSGKSTLLRAIAGIYKPTAGSIGVSGRIGALLNPSAGMDMDATGYENIFLRGYLLGLKRGEILERIDDIAEFTELGDFLNLPLRTYSQGMFARLAFAISTSIRPDILLIDEGIGTSDTAFREKMRLRLEEFVEKANILIIASHDESLLDRFCNTRLRLEHGRMVEASGEA